VYVKSGVTFLFTFEPTYDNGQPSCWKGMLRLQQPSKYLAQCSLGVDRSAPVGGVERVPRKNEDETRTADRVGPAGLQTADLLRSEAGTWDG
jgi:hypothetical protein